MRRFRPFALCTVLLFAASLLFGCAARRPDADPTAAPDPAAAPAGETENEKEKLASFTVYDADGNAVDSLSFIGKPAIINFWATWCPPCRAELPDFEEAYQTYGDRISFVMTDCTDGYQETQASAESFVKENGYTFPLYFDSEGSGSRAYNVTGIPTSIFVDADGNVAKVHVGMLTKEALAAEIAAILQ